jgi:hypothetical protein
MRFRRAAYENHILAAGDPIVTIPIVQAHTQQTDYLLFTLFTLSRHKYFSLSARELMALSTIGGIWGLGQR